MRFLISFLLFFSFCSLQAQIATISDEIYLRNEDEFRIIGQVGEYFWVIKDQPEGSKIFAYDKYMKLKYEKEVAVQKKRHDIIGTVARKDYFGLVLTYKNKGAAKVEFHKFDVAGDLVDSLTIKDYGRRNFAPRPEVVRSRDYTKLCVFSDTEENLMEATAFDIEKLEVMWDSDMKTGDLSLREDLFQILLDPTGTFHMIFNKDNIKSKRETNRFIILGNSKSGRSTIEIPFTDKLIYDAYFDYNKSNQSISAAGLFDTKRNTRATGAFYIDIPTNRPDNYKINFHEFDIDFLSKLSGKEVQEGAALSEVYVNDIIMGSNGSLVMVAERYKKISQAYDPSFPQSVNERYKGGRAEFHYNDVVVIGFDNEGDIQYKDVFYKRQFSRDDGGFMSSFFIRRTPTQVAFLYNDEIKSKDNVVGEYSMDRFGESDRRSVLDTQGYGVRLLFKDAVQINNNEIMVPSIKRKNLKFVRIKF